VTEITYLGQHTNADHSLGCFFTQINPGTPLIVIGAISLIGMVFQKPFRKLKSKLLDDGLDEDEIENFELY